MKGIWFISLLTLGWALGGQSVKTPTHLRYKHFDDYLSNLNNNEQDWITGNREEIEGSGDASDSPMTGSKSLPYRTGLKRSKQVTCCMLGTMAGDKGYHCYANFYVARIMMRNRNRAHNRKIVFGNNEDMNKSRVKLMRTFEKCVSKQSSIFHKCCHYSAMTIPDYIKKDSQQAKKYKDKMQQTKTLKSA